jgi:DNA ligase D-like protein (predicted 3'-phosphoesterase)
VERVDLRERQELADLDHLRGLGLERLDLLVRERDVLALRELVALHHLLARDDLLVRGAPVLLLHARAALVQHVERDLAARLGGRVELDRDRDETERDRRRRDRASCHVRILTSVPASVNTHKRRWIWRRSVPRGRELSERDRRGLRAYRAKRDADRTPEPFGAERADRPGLFVVQQHAARRLHYDLRLEWRGVLLSWAVPKGPSLDPRRSGSRSRSRTTRSSTPTSKGMIPEGNYGAGAVIVWDLGRWIPVEDPDEGLVSGSSCSTSRATSCAAGSRWCGPQGRRSPTGGIGC